MQGQTDRYSILYDDEKQDAFNQVFGPWFEKFSDVIPPHIAGYMAEGLHYLVAQMTALTTMKGIEDQRAQPQNTEAILDACMGNVHTMDIVLNEYFQENALAPGGPVYRNKLSTVEEYEVRQVVLSHMRTLFETDERETPPKLGQAELFYVLKEVGMKCYEAGKPAPIEILKIASAWEAAGFKSGLQMCALKNHKLKSQNP